MSHTFNDKSNTIGEYHLHCKETKALLVTDYIKEMEKLPHSVYLNYIRGIKDLLPEPVKESLIKALSKFKIHTWAAWKGRKDYRDKWIKNSDRGHEYQIELYKDYYNKAKMGYSILTSCPSEKKELSPLPDVEEINEDLTEDIKTSEFSEVVESSFWKKCDLPEKKIQDKTVINAYLKQLLYGITLEALLLLTNKHMICITLKHEVEDCDGDAAKYRQSIKKYLSDIGVSKSIKQKILSSKNLLNRTNRVFYNMAPFEDDEITWTECFTICSHMFNHSKSFRDISVDSSGLVQEVNYYANCSFVLSYLIQETFEIIRIFVNKIRNVRQIVNHITVIDKILKEEIKTDKDDYWDYTTKEINKLNRISQLIYIPFMTYLSRYTSVLSATKEKYVPFADFSVQIPLFTPYYESEIKFVELELLPNGNIDFRNEINKKCLHYWQSLYPNNRGTKLKKTYDTTFVVLNQERKIVTCVVNDE